MFKKRKANKKIETLLDEWRNGDKKIAPSKYVGMSHTEFQDWASSGKLPERFLK